MITIDLSKQQAHGADLRLIQQINFTTNLDREGDTRKFLFLKKSKKDYFRLFTRNCNSNTSLLYSNLILI